MVLAAHDVCDGGVEVVDRDGEVVQHRSVGARDHGLVEVHVLEAGVAADHVVHDGRALVGHAQAHRAVCLGLAPKATVCAVALLVGPDVIGGRARAVGVPAVEQRLRAPRAWRSARSL